MITTPLPSGGPVLVSMLNILEGFNFTNKDQGKSRSYHYIIEVRKTSTYRVQTLKPFTFISFPSSEIVGKIPEVNNLRANVTNSQTFGGNSSNIDFVHILLLDKP